MKEMNWTREEALKRLAIMYHSTKHAMEAAAIEAVTMPEKRIRERMFENACEKKDIMVGILMSAEAMGIDRSEVSDLEVDEEEMHAFLEEFSKDVDERTRKEMEQDMPSGLKDILSGLFG